MDGADVGVRVATVDDLEALVQMWVDLAVGQRAYGSHLLGEPNEAAIRDHLTRQVLGDRVAVATAEKPVGFVSFAVETGRYDQDVTRGIVQDLYVRPARRGEGIGTRLLATAERALAGDGAGVVALEAMATNDDATRFYEARGYTPHRIEFERPVAEEWKESDT